MASKVLQGDPRRPGDLHPFVREQVDPDDAPGDWYAFFSLVLGFLAFTMKVRPVKMHNIIFYILFVDNNNNLLFSCVSLVEGVGLGLAAALRGLVHQHEVAGYEHDAGGHVFLLLHKRPRVRLHGRHASRNAHAPICPHGRSPHFVDKRNI